MEISSDPLEFDVRNFRYLWIITYELCLPKQNMAMVRNYGAVICQNKLLHIL
jgi:hypothetical protein